MKILFAVILVLHSINAAVSEDVPSPEAKTFNRNWACGSTIRQKTVRITNPAQPVTECIYRIQSVNSNVLQLRIDFDIGLQAPTLPFDSPQSPVKVPTCTADEFTVGNLRFCGISRAQHIYLPFNATRQTRPVRPRVITLRFRLANRSGQTGLPVAFWNLNITQIEVPLGGPRSLSAPAVFRTADNEAATNIATRTFWNRADSWLRAPNGCLQYFPHAEGVFESFNFNEGRGPYLPNQDYFICFRRKETDRKITLTFESFGLASIQTATAGFDANCLSPDPTATSSEDFLLVPNAVTQENIRVIRLCGNSVHTEVIVATQPGPFAIQFHSDNLYNARVFTEAGFRIRYKID